MRLGRRARRRRRRVGLRSALGLVRLPRAAQRRIPDRWDRGIGGRLLQPVLEAFTSWNVRQAGLFTFADSPKHLGLYQRHGFWPGSLTVVTAKEVGPTGTRPHALFSNEPKDRHDPVLDEIRGLTEEIFGGLDLGSEIVAVNEQGIGDTVLLHRDGALEGMAVCHCGAGSEAGSDTCYVKFAAVRPGEGAAMSFERLLDACEAFAAESGLGRLVAGVNTGRLDAYRRLLARDFRAERIGITHAAAPRGAALRHAGALRDRRSPLTRREAQATAAFERHPSWYEVRTTSE